MTWSSVLSFIFNLFGLYETAQAELAAGQPASTPKVRIGTIGGKPLYVTGTLSTQ